MESKVIFINTDSKNIILDFSTSQAIPERNGDDLVFILPDGTKMVIKDFYINPDDIKTFEVNGKQFSPSELLIAMEADDLLPAMEKLLQNGIRFHNSEDTAILDGYGHLNGLDYRSALLHLPDVQKQNPAMYSRASHLNEFSLVDGAELNSDIMYGQKYDISFSYPAKDGFSNITVEYSAFNSQNEFRQNDLPSGAGEAGPSHPQPVIPLPDPIEPVTPEPIVKPEKPVPSEPELPKPVEPVAPGPVTPEPIVKPEKPVPSEPELPKPVEPVTPGPVTPEPIVKPEKPVPSEPELPTPVEPVTPGPVTPEPIVKPEKPVPSEPELPKPVEPVTPGPVTPEPIEKPEKPVQPEPELPKPLNLNLENIVVSESDKGNGIAVAVPGYEIVEAMNNGNYGKINKNPDGVWEYNLLKSVNHPNPGADVLKDAEVIQLKIRDKIGNEHTVQQKIDIIDSVPTVSVNEIKESVISGSPVPISGDIGINYGFDNYGKIIVTPNDGKQTYDANVEIIGDHGKLIIWPDGQYTYYANPKNNDQTSGTDVFNIEFYDGDGDCTVSKIIIDVTKPNAPVADNIAANESGIRTGNAVALASKDFEIVEVIENGRYGNVAFNNGQWEYTLNKGFAHSLGTANKKAMNADMIVLKVKDTYGNCYDIEQKLDIIDGGPSFRAPDFGIVKAGETVSGALEYDFGADNGKEAKITIAANNAEIDWRPGQTVEIIGKNGILKIDGDGGYTYQANHNAVAPGNTVSEDFIFHITDSDGTSVIGKTVPILVSRAALPEFDDNHITVNEGDFKDIKGASGEISIFDKNGKQYEIVEVVENGYFGNVMQENGKWFYKLAKGVPHTGDGKDLLKNADMITLKARDENGDIFVVSKKIDVVDDIPEIDRTLNDLGIVVQGTQSALSGRLEYDFGLDSDEGSAIIVTVNNKEHEFVPGTEQAIQGSYGKLLIAPDGTYRYLADGTKTGKDTFTIKIKDADGDIVDLDSSGKPLAIVVRVMESHAPEAGEVAIKEADLRNGGTCATDLAVEGFEILGVVANGMMGTTCQVDGKWQYVLNGPVIHGAQGKDSVSDSIKLKVRDQAGVEYEHSVKINIVDDTPELMISGEGIVRCGETLTGTFTAEFGADGPGNIIVIFNGIETAFVTGMVIHGTYGDLTLGDGVWNYKANSLNQFGRDNFKFKISDGDGDIIDTQAGAGILIGEKKPFEIDVNVLPDAVTIAPEKIYEQELAFGDVRLDIAVDGWTIVSAVPQGNAGKMVKLDDGTWQYVLDKPLNHHNSVDIVDNVRLTLKNSAGNTVMVDKRIDIVDDKPRLSLEEADIPIADGIFVREKDLATGNAKALLEGADYQILGIIKNGTYGTAKIVDGQWIYELNGAMDSGNGTNIVKNADSIILKIMDNNGFLRKLEVPVDILDDVPTKNFKYILVHAPVIPGAEYSGNVLDAIFKNGENEIDFGADGFGEFSMSDDSSYQNSAVGKMIANNANGSWKFVMNSNPDANVISRNSKYSISLYDKDGDDDGAGTILILDHFNENIVPVEIIGADGNDFINPNPEWNLHSKYQDYLASQENIIYGGKGDDIIFGEGCKIPADMSQDEFIEYCIAYKINLNDGLLLPYQGGYLPNLIYGGSGNDFIYGTGAGSVIFGDGSDSPINNTFEQFLNLVGLNSKFYDTVCDLSNKFNSKQMEDIADMLESYESDSDGDDYIRLGGSANYSMTVSGGGNDTILTTTFTLTFSGSGDDFIKGGSNNRVYAGSGNDIVIGVYNNYVSLGDGNDICMISTPYNAFIDGGNGIDIIAMANMTNLTNWGDNLSDCLKEGIVENIEIALWGDVYKWFYPIFSNISPDSTRERIYGTGDRQIIINDESNTITLGEGWQKVIGSETGKDYYRTQTFIYTEADGNKLKLETTLGVNQDGSEKSDLEKRTVLSGHESEIPGQLQFGFGADSTTGKKLSVIMNGVETVLIPDKENLVTGKYGTLKISEQGIFSYKALPNKEGVDDFYFRIQDSDGNIIDKDLSGNPLKLSVNIVMPEPPEDIASVRYESQLKDGPIEIPFGLAGYKILDAKLDSNVASIIQNPDNSWKYVLNKSIDHKGEFQYTDIILMKVEDRYGNIYDLQKVINIVDSYPFNHSIDICTTNATEFSGNSKVEGSDYKLFYNFYADNDPAKTSFTVRDGLESKTVHENVETVIHGKYGELVFTATNGNIVFHYKTSDEFAANKIDGKETFEFILRDSDGSIAKNYINIDMKFSIDIMESELQNGPVSQIISLPQEMAGCHIIEAKVEGHAGYVTLGADGNWYYNLNNNLEHTLDNSHIYKKKDIDGTILEKDENIIVDTISVWYRDETGRLNYYEKTVNIMDSEPFFVNFKYDATNMKTIIGTTALKGVENAYSFGADDDPSKTKLFISAGGEEQEVIIGEPMEINGLYGKLSFNASTGHLSFMYEANEAVNHSDKFTFRIIDSDGDEKTGSFIINTTFNNDYDPAQNYDLSNIHPLDTVPINLDDSHSAYLLDEVMIWDNQNQHASLKMAYSKQPSLNSEMSQENDNAENFLVEETMVEQELSDVISSQPVNAQAQIPVAGSILDSIDDIAPITLYHDQDWEHAMTNALNPAI